CRGHGPGRSGRGRLRGLRRPGRVRGPPRLPRPPWRAAAGRGDHRCGEAGRHRRHRSRQRRAGRRPARGCDPQRRPGSGEREPAQPVRPAARPGHQGRGRLRRLARRGRARQRRRAAGGGARAAARGPGRAGHARRRRRERDRRHARRLGGRPVPDGPHHLARRHCRHNRGQREGQLHQGDRAYPGAELAGHARPQARAPAARDRVARDSAARDSAARDRAARAAAPGHDPGSAARIGQVSTPVAERGSARPRGGGIGRAALLIGAITMLARVIGFGRQVVFAHTVQASCLGTAYTTANMVPNIVYDIVAGGALTAVVVPVLAGPARSDPEQVRRTSAALLTWAVVLLVPVSLVVAVIAEPLVSVLLGGTPGCPRADMVTLGARMLVVFAPQILLYGLAVVLYGILQAHRKFVAPALAPVLASLVVIGAYFWFGVVGSGYQDMTRPVPAPAWIVLAVGTTAGVAALVATPLIPVARLHLRLRPRLRFPPGIGVRVRSLAAAGVATLIAQDASVAVVIVLANSRGGSGALVL